MESSESSCEESATTASIKDIELSDPENGSENIFEPREFGPRLFRRSSGSRNLFATSGYPSGTIFGMWVSTRNSDENETDGETRENVDDEIIDTNFDCPICLENLDVNEKVTMPGGCDDKICKSCMENHLKSKIMSGKVMSLMCPCCSVDLNDSFVEESVSTYHFKKMLTFRQMKLDPNGRMCPKCEHVQSGNKSKPEMKCEECGVEYCFLHSDAHPNTSCKEFEKNAKKETKGDRKAVKKESVACPGCSAPVYKDSGCNHMTCSVCSTSFCWLCGRQICADGFPTHYKWWNIFGCPTLQMREGLSPNIKCKLLFWKLLFLLCVIILLPIVIVLIGIILVLVVAIIAIILALVILILLLWPILIIVCLPITLYKYCKYNNKSVGCGRICCPIVSCIKGQWSSDDIDSEWDV
eukprot:TRINITY_DN975_c0_g2_i1.p1 TRINITY_DN975_c0_g2~~TRINITY_DN975_c0_g2_i1.p1  ORF type:complete len:411 (+),score=48.54 TRINITY_DN975_c0_g2_i1:124-1356(+)